MNKRLRWFDDSAPMLRLVAFRLGLDGSLSADEDCNACPLCLRVFTRQAAIDGELTEEHVPPKSLDGRGLLLTCCDCNNSAGSKIDAQAARQREVVDFARGMASAMVSVTIHADGVPLRGEARWSDRGLEIFGVPQRNNPMEQAEHLRTLDAFVERGTPNPSVVITTDMHFEEVHVRLSWVRSAYLVAFAALGWSYVLRDVMQPIRDQLMRSDERILPTNMLRDPDAPPNKRRMLLVEQPDELRSLAVTLGEWTVFLPGISRPLTYQQLSEGVAQTRNGHSRVKFRLHGKGVPWPSRPVYALDRLTV
ncbi:hypothetical protein [Tenggerimyces flavus]|uniref:HNH endonuclease n=1 Tax=Tenggerimyces flavus TaxID=1708749 RepID=A0ABV7YJM0_9ACTN|nr:hypothetical protein [Tenggerimyces flavus]MBM7787600.1 hypothetical protein [Tenggerimyces flavus]